MKDLKKECLNLEESCSCGHEHHDHHDHEHHDHEHHDHEHHDHHHSHEEACSCGHAHHQEHQHEHHKLLKGEKKQVYLLENLGCANCAAKMERKIRELPEIRYANLAFATKQLQLVTAPGGDYSEEELLEKIRRICQSIESEVVVTKREENVKRANREDSEQKNSLLAEHKKDFIEILVGAVFLLLAKILEVPFKPVAVLLYVIGYLALGRGILLAAAKNLFKGHVFDENFLMSIATLGAFGVGIYGDIIGNAAGMQVEGYAEAVGVMLFYRIGELFEEVAVARSRSQIMEAVDMRPETVNLISAEDVSVIPAGKAKIGDILLVRPGDRIPLDGKIIDGMTQIDTSPITGEPVPVSAHEGDAVVSGCVNLSGVIRVQVEKVLEESMVTRILDSVENAAASKPKIDRFITRFSRVYTPVVVLIALLTAILPSMLTGEWQYWIYTALTFLVISCPCALVLSVPLAFFSGIGAASKKGILFKGGAAIEALGNVQAVVMDKTGTVTEGNFVVQKVFAVEGMDEDDLLKLAGSCEKNSTHPIARSIMKELEQRGIMPENPKEITEISGKGVKAILQEGEILCGNRKLMIEGEIPLADENSDYGTEVFVACNGAYVGSIVIADTVKKDAISAIGQLKKSGISTVMLTGDAKKNAQAVAEHTGIEHVYAQLLPQEKVEKLQEIRKARGKVLFVGDGINDAPVLAGADVGAAMGSGADAAIEAADVVYMTSSVEAIPQSMKIASVTAMVARQNVIFALFVKVLVMIVGLSGGANMWMAVFADTGVAMLCILNSIRILYRRKGKEKK